MLQEIVKPENNTEWDILNRLNAFGVKIDIRPGGIYANVLRATEDSITAEELEMRMMKQNPSLFPPGPKHFPKGDCRPHRQRGFSQAR